MRTALKKVASWMSVDKLERVLAYAIQRSAFHALASTPIYCSREALWSHCAQDVVGANSAMAYVEFGVFEGRSIRFFANENHNPNSVFIGLDSFRGLPEGWKPSEPSGLFNVDGKIPVVEDPRVTFIKGWFQDTWGQLEPQIPWRDHLVVHYDADIYSSTLFALSKIDSLNRKYIAIFDEFTGHETRALYNYSHSFNASISFLARVNLRGFPDQVLCLIEPRGTVLKNSRAANTS